MSDMVQCNVLTKFMAVPTRKVDNQMNEHPRYTVNFKE